MKVFTRLANRLGLYSKKQIDQRFRTMFGNFQAALTSRLTQDWTTSTLSSDSQAKMDLVALRSRCRDLRDNNDHAAKFIGMVKSNVLGEGGIHFRSGVKSPDKVVVNELIPGTPDTYANKVIEEGWYDWGRNHCTIHGGLTWCDVQKVVLEAVATDGEVLVQRIIDADNPYGFTLRIIESDYIDEQYNGTAENGNEVRMGVEVDRFKRKVAYYLWGTHPNDSHFFGQQNRQRIRVDADEIIHLGLISRPEQTRFLPWMRTAAYKLHMIGEYEKAEAVLKRVTASKLGFLIPPVDPAFPSEFPGEEEAGTGNLFEDTEPGSFKQLPRGWDVKAVDWKQDSENYAIFIKAALRSVASGLGVSYNDLANDMESVNFASGKIGIQYQREMFKALQYWFIEKFCEDVFSWWLKGSLLSGVLGNLEFKPERFSKFNAPIFRGRRWVSIDPQKDVDATIRKLNAGLTSHTRVLAEENIDRDELLDEIEADKAAMELRGITAPELESKLAATNGVDGSDSVQSNNGNGSPDRQADRPVAD